ncbi:MAG: DNA polymerase III subunit gamma/tau [Bacteroidota bacterium]|nr:DNA polymerase III subunit gamma/tau [Candidatus Kapabacteria bacterium]MDW8219395.1 DNA polymerase III subunit gamma/tau [Bacteroidota bacterium]
MEHTRVEEQYLVTARKWRPQRFADVVGQEHVCRTLRNAVQSHRVHHAYIFNGPRGVGKTTTARILAKAVNCESLTEDSEPCNRCSSCIEISSGRSLDVIEIDGASNNSVDDIRKLRENVKYPPIKGKYKLYIIDEVHMLSTSAFNALLKTLEEPPRHLIFVFATTEPHKVPATILSRCQRFDFRRMQIDDVSTQLRYIAEQEGIHIDDESLTVIAKKSDGSMRDAQSIFDQVVAFCGHHVEYARVNEALNLIDGELYFTLGRAIRNHDVASVLNIVREIFLRGYDMQECLHGLAEHFRNILTVLATGSSALIEASKVHRQQYAEEAQYFTQADVLQYMTIIMNTDQALRFAPQPRLRFEFALVEMAKLDAAVQISELLAELAEIKKKLGDTERTLISSDSTPVLSTASPPSRLKTSAASPEHPIKQKFPQSVENAVENVEYNKHCVENQGKVQQDSSAQPSVVLSYSSTQSTTAQRTGNTKKHQTATDIEQHWRHVVHKTSVLGDDLKTYCEQPDMVQVQYHDTAIHLYPKFGFIADALREKIPHIERALHAAAGQAIRVEIRLDNSGDAHEFSSFDFPSCEHSQNTADSSENQQQRSNGRSQETELPQPQGIVHELDKAIIELFSAVALPRRF